MAAPIVKNPENQQLVDALWELAENLAMSAQWESKSLRRAATSLAGLTSRIVSGKILSNGPAKVEGVGTVIGAYIDEFCKTGKLQRLERLNRNPPALVSPERRQANHKAHEIFIHCAPISTLWGIVVAERLGYTPREAATYGNWISFDLTRQAKRKPEDNFDEVPQAKRRRIEFVNLFATFEKIPVMEYFGEKLAVHPKSNGKVIHPEVVQDYLEEKFGDQLQDARQALEDLANSVSTDKLEKEALQLYKEFCPPFQGSSVPSPWKLEKVRQLARVGLP